MDPSSSFESRLDLACQSAATREAFVGDRISARRSNQLVLISAIAGCLSLEPSFTRRRALAAFPHASPKTIDRALSAMEASGMIDVLERNTRQSRGGAAYRLTGPEQWHAFDADIAQARALRSGRIPKKP